MDLYDIAIAKKLAGGGGGGGSSDFSTAEVTVINNSEDVVALLTPLIDDEVLASEVNIFPNSSISVDVVLYNGVKDDVFVVVNETVIVPSSISGDIVDAGDGFLVISGDGTITIS